MRLSSFVAACLIGLVIGIVSPDVWARTFYNVTNLMTYNNTLANVAWTKEATVTVSDADATCPLSEGVRMSLVTSGTAGNGVSRDLSLTPSRSVYLAQPTGGSACGVAVSDYSGDNPTTATLGTTATRVTAYTAGNTGIKVYGTGTASSTAVPVGTAQNLYLGVPIKDGNYLYSASAEYNIGVTRLKIVDISNPSVPVFVGEAFSNADPYGIGIFKIGNYVYSAGRQATMRFDVTTPASPTVSLVTGSVRSYRSVRSGNGYVYGMVDSTFYVGSTVDFTTVGTVALWGDYWGDMAYYDAGAEKYIYLWRSSASGGYGDIVIIKVTNPAAPVVIAGQNFRDYPTSTGVIAGGYIYAGGTDYSGAWTSVFSLANPESLTRVNTIKTGCGSHGYGHLNANGYVYFPCYVGSGLYIGQYDVTTNPTIPTAKLVKLGSNNPATMDAVFALTTDANYAYAVTRENNTNNDNAWTVKIPFSDACTSWCQSGAQLTADTFSTRGYCGPTTSAAVTCKLWH